MTEYSNFLENPFIKTPLQSVFSYEDYSFRNTKAYTTSPKQFFPLLLFSCSLISNSLWPHGLQRTRLPCPSLSPGACPNSCPFSQWCHQPSCPLLSSFPAFNLSQHQGLFQWVSSLQYLVIFCVCVCVCVWRLLQLWPTLSDPMVCNPPGYSIHGILQARILEWIAMPSSRRSSWPTVRTRVSFVSCIGRQEIFLPLVPPGKPDISHSSFLINIYRSALFSLMRSVAQLCPTLCEPTRLLCPWDFPKKNTGVGCHLLLQNSL